MSETCQQLAHDRSLRRRDSPGASRGIPAPDFRSLQTRPADHTEAGGGGTRQGREGQYLWTPPRLARNNNMATREQRDGDATGRWRAP